MGGAPSGGLPGAGLRGALGDSLASRLVAPISSGGPVRARNPGGVRTKGREKLPAASPPRPLPCSPAPSSFKPRLARVVSVQPGRGREGMAEQPEPQVKGARPPPCGAWGSALPPAPKPAPESPRSLPRPRPLPSAAERPAGGGRLASPRCVPCLSHSFWRQSRWPGRESPPLGGGRGVGRRAPGCVRGRVAGGGGGAVPEKLGGSARQVVPLACLAAGGERGGGGPRGYPATAWEGPGRVGSSQNNAS